MQTEAQLEGSWLNPGCQLMVFWSCFHRKGRLSTCEFLSVQTATEMWFSMIYHRRWLYGNLTPFSRRLQTDLLQHLWQVLVSVLLFAKHILSEWSIVIVQRFVGCLVILLRIMLSVGLWICYCCIDNKTLLSCTSVHRDTGFEIIPPLTWFGKISVTC